METNPGPLRERRIRYPVLHNGKRPVGRPRMKWENNINHKLREVDYTGDDWKTLAYVRTAMNLRVR
ncbi:hypothetical protein C0J52_28046 [Blattella germanica]|nr:hypothetical protein C0J52_28046 [Blattella germanica]